MSDFLKLVGNRIRVIRRARGLTQEALAEKAELQPTYVGGVERGERNISLQTLEKIIEGLGITPYELFKFEELDMTETTLEKKRKIDNINNLLIERDEKEIEMIYKLVTDIIDVIDSK